MDSLTLPPPSSTSFFVQRRCPSSAIFHLAISHLRAIPHPDARAIIISSSRSLLQQNLTEERDSWLHQHSLTGAYRAYIDRIHVFYPADLFQWSLLCSTLTDKYKSAASIPRSSKAIVQDGLAMIILHEPSHYFLENFASPQHTLATYVNLITQAFAAANALSSETVRTCLVLFDSKVESLKLPVLSPKVLQLQPTTTGEAQDTEDESMRRDESVRDVIQKFFEWNGYMTEENGQWKLTLLEMNI